MSLLQSTQFRTDRSGNATRRALLRTWPEFQNPVAWLVALILVIMPLIANGFFLIEIFATTLILGAIFGVIFAAVAYAFTGGKRDFSSATAIVAGHYDVLCDPDAAPQARDLIAGQLPIDDTSQPNA